jgi:hypothetical protein
MRVDVLVQLNEDPRAGSKCGVEDIKLDGGIKLRGTL